MSNKKRIIVTGGAGFIGSSVIRQYIADADADAEEEIAFEQGYINKKQLIELAQSLKKNKYGQYLLTTVSGGVL